MGIDGRDGPNLACLGCDLPVGTRMDDCGCWQVVRLVPQAVVRLLGPPERPVMDRAELPGWWWPPGARPSRWRPDRSWSSSAGHLVRCCPPGKARSGWTWQDRGSASRSLTWCWCRSVRRPETCGSRVPGGAGTHGCRTLGRARLPATPDPPAGSRRTAGRRGTGRPAAGRTRLVPAGVPRSWTTGRPSCAQRPPQCRTSHVARHRIRDVAGLEPERGGYALRHAMKWPGRLGRSPPTPRGKSTEPDTR